MPNSKPFPSKEADLNNYFITAVDYLLVSANATRLLVSSGNQTLLTNQLASWKAAYALTTNIDTRTRTAIDNKDKAKVDLMDTLRNVYNDIPESVFTTADRNTLNIPKRSDTRTPVPVPSTKPIVQVDTSNRLMHEISFTDENGSAAKPAGVHSCQVWLKVGSAAIDPSELSFAGSATASSFELKFKGEDAGKNVYYWLRWENTRGETGPWSDAVMATVTG